MSRIVFSTGAGISVPSGIPPYRGKGGIYEDSEVENKVSAHTFNTARYVVEKHIVEMQNKIKNCQPNAAHLAIAELEKDHDVTVITQNIDNLHILAGSTNVIELHGNIFKTRMTERTIFNMMDEDWVTEERPDVVLFGENIDAEKWRKAWAATEDSDVFIAIGTSASVWPARDLLDMANDRKYIQSIPFLFMSTDAPPQDLHFATFVEGSAEITVPEVCKQINVLLR